MSKKCPNCLEIFDDNYMFCSNCGTRLIDNTANPSFNIGDGNAISGGVNIDTSKHVTSHDTHYHSTIHERSKSESELQLEASNQLRSKAESIIAERGRLDSVALAQLRPIALQLGIDEETFKSIIKDVRTNRNGGNTGLGAANARYLQQAQQAVQTNDMDALSNLTPRLEAMAAISHDDNVQYLYYLTLSLLYPIKSMEVYERQTDENYWRTFWAIISYVRTGKYAEATKVLALFEPSRFEKSEDDQNLLEAYSNIMMDDKDAAQEFLDEILGEPSEQIRPLLRAIESRLYEEEVDNLEARFYIERVLSKSDSAYKSSKKTESPTLNVSVPEEKSESAEGVTETNSEADSIYAAANEASGAKRIMLLQKAVDAGSKDAMNDLGNCYCYGEDIESDQGLAEMWYKKAADLGHSEAQSNLGMMYMSFNMRNYPLAEKYLKMSAEQGSNYAQTMLADLYMEIEDYPNALIWANKASQGDKPYDAYYILGKIYYYGLGVTQNIEESVRCLQKVDNNDFCMYRTLAFDLLGYIYLSKDHNLYNEVQAFYYYNKCANENNYYGYNLGLCYANGWGCKQDMGLARMWMEKSSEEDNESATNWLAENPLSVESATSPLPANTTTQSMEPTEPYITIDNVWVDTDGVGLLYFHCDWTAYNLKSKCMQLRLNIAAKTGKKIKYDASLNQYYFLKDRLVIKEDVHKFHNTILSLDQYELNMSHNEEKHMEFTLEIVKHATGESYQITKIMNISVWIYYNIFSANKFEIRSLDIL